MHITRRGALALGALAGMARTAEATTTLDRTARIVIGLPPGGPYDTLARLLAEQLRGRWAPQVIVENRPGASVRLAAEAVKAAAPDGATILLTPLPVMTLTPVAMPRTTRYDPFTDFTPVATIGVTRFCWLVRADHPARDLPAFLAWARGRGGATFAPPVVGAPQHLIGLAVSQRSGVPLTAVSYRGAAPALQDLLGGQIDSYIGVLGDGIPAVRGGLARMLAVSGSRRLDSLPDVPALMEAGFAELPEDEATGAVMLPAGAADRVVMALHAAVVEAVAAAPLRQRLATTETAPQVLAPNDLAARMRAERALYESIVRATGFRPEE
ncbi:tripartite tricarboxylate transporter substrate binding protein [Roseomonas sp. HF4]|uniref:Bug family tripartite tricarboxylate transporter substrate binding protein n=1 Tax=Roseomonas sp. HF4 TaxID=2562313 RepID=UPI0010C0572A|nr:tripartite tricarboxylate transporter substrate-binding protein [Roseomonas sp. HF4]